MPDLNEVIERSEKRMEGASSILNDLLTYPITKDMIVLPDIEINEEDKQSA